MECREWNADRGLAFMVVQFRVRAWLDFVNGHVARLADIVVVVVRTGRERDGDTADFHRANLLGNEAEVVGGVERARRAEDLAADGDAGYRRDDARAARADRGVVRIAKVCVRGSG